MNDELIVELKKLNRRLTWLTLGGVVSLGVVNALILKLLLDMFEFHQLWADLLADHFGEWMNRLYLRLGDR